MTRSSIGKNCSCCHFSKTGILELFRHNKRQRIESRPTYVIARSEDVIHSLELWSIFEGLMKKKCPMIVHRYIVHQSEVEKKGLYSENRLSEITGSVEHFFFYIHPRKYNLTVLPYHISCNVRVSGDVSVCRNKSRIVHHDATECHQGKLYPIHRSVPTRRSAHRFFYIPDLRMNWQNVFRFA